MSVTAGVKAKPFSWSYSQLSGFETCPRRYQAYNITKEVVEPESDNLREGNRLHKAFENRVAFGEKLPLGLGMHEAMLAQLASAPGQVLPERKLALNQALAPVAWFAPGAWFRQVIDYTNIRDGGVAIVVDYKTGKPRDDTTQLELSALMIMAHDPGVVRVKAAFMYVNYEHVESQTYTSEQVPGLWGDILPRVNAFKRAREHDEYPAKPGGLCRRWCAVTSCPYHGT